AALAADFSYAAHVPPAGRPAGRLGGYREVGSTQSSSEHFHEVFMSLRIQLGSITIQRVVEQEAPFFDALQFFPTLSKELLADNRAWLRPIYLDAEDKLILCIQSYVVQTPDRNILIDTCVGNHKPRPTRAFWHMLDSDRY